MSSPPAGGSSPRSSGQESESATPSVLDLQRLIQDRLTSALRARPGELAALSCTSCDSQSCNGRVQ